MNLGFLNFENKNDYKEFLKYLEIHSKEEPIEYLERHRAILNTYREL